MHVGLYPGTAQWLGINSAEDLDWILPNRGKFDNILSGHDLFVDAPAGPPPTTTPGPTPPSPTPPTTNGPVLTYYEGEDATWNGSTRIGTSHTGATGGAYADMGGIDSWVEFSNVDSGAGGICILSFRYANGSTNDRQCSVAVNGNSIGTLSFSPTTDWVIWEYATIETTCAPGPNVIRITAVTGAGGPNIDHLAHSTPTITTPTKLPTSNPTPLPTTTQPTNQPTFPAPTPDPTPNPTVSYAERPVYFI